MKFNISMVYRALGTCSTCPLADISNGKLVCKSNNSIVDVFNPDYNCPEGKWKSEINHPIGTVITHHVKSNWEKAAEFVKTATSGFVDDATLAKRQESCRTCPKLKEVKGKFYCGACSCPSWKLSELDIKLKFKGLECPLARPGFANS